MSRKAAVEPKWNFYLDTNKSTGIQYVQTSYNIGFRKEASLDLEARPTSAGCSLTVQSAPRSLS